MVFLREVLLQGICCREKTGLLFSVDVFSCKLAYRIFSSNLYVSYVVEERAIGAQIWRWGCLTKVVRWIDTNGRIEVGSS